MQPRPLPASHWFFLGAAVLLMGTEGVPPPSQSITEFVAYGKYAVVFTGPKTNWNSAFTTFQGISPGASLFIVNSAADSFWLGSRINREKDQVSVVSKFWVGLEARTPQGLLQWLDGTPFTYHVEVVIADGYDDPEKVFAWAVPDSGTKLKYEFLTPEDNKEAFISQYYNYY